jgi:hypothetical protein
MEMLINARLRDVLTVTKVRGIKMNHKSRGARVFALSFLAIAGLMAFMAVGAQASEKAWLLLGVDIPANQKVLAEAHTEGNLKVKEETNLEILCKTIETEDLLLIKSTTEAKGKVKFTNCKTWQNGADITTNCKPVEPITAGGIALLILHPVEKPLVYVLFEPETVGGNFSQIKFKSPCALPETNNVKGSLVAECATLVEDKEKEPVVKLIVGETCLTERVLHLLQPASAELFKEDGLIYAKKTAVLSGTVSVVLENGEPWCGHV